MMDRYVAPSTDIRFALDVVGLDDLLSLESFGELDAELSLTLLDEFGRFASEVIAPLDRVGDVEGSRLDPDTARVVTPTGFRDAYARYVAAGWGAVTAERAHGGGGFPRLVGVGMEEMFASANLALSLCPMLTASAIELFGAWGTADQQRRFLPKLVTGEWTGTMVLTEPQAGSDLGAATTMARPDPDDGWRISGTKIFITWGDHDLSDNVVHLVLARTPDAPPGTKGLSLFAVPAREVDHGGQLGPRNAISVVSIEHKLGIHASPTCVLSFEDAGGELVGDLHGGMRAMFTMMNNARLSVGVEGLGVAEAAYQLAVGHAIERRQGRLPQQPAGTSTPISEHPDVRRSLVSMRAQIDAMRLLLYATAHALDLSRHHPDQVTRQQQSALGDLFTPIAKAWCTDLGVELASTALQVHGGMGYIEETGIARHYRNARIAPIYEGTNGIQAIDLVTRKVARDDGATLDTLITDIAKLADELTGAGAGPSAGSVGERLAPIGPQLGESATTLRRAAGWLLDRHSTAPIDALAGATPFLRLAGNVIGGWLLTRQAVYASRASGYPSAYLDAKITTARVYAQQVLPVSAGLAASATAGADDLYTIDQSDLPTR